MKIPRSFILLTTLLFAFLPSVGHAQATFNFQDGAGGYSGTADTNIYDSRDTKNFGGNDQIYTRYNSDSSGGAGYNIDREGRNILLRFDNIQSSLSGQTVTEASISLTVSTIAAGGGETSAALFAYEILQDWNEGTGTGSSGTSGSANWNSRIDGSSWQLAGAKGSNDRNLTPIFTSSDFNVGGTDSIAAEDTLTIELPTSLVQSWIDTPSSNHGLLISIGTQNQYRYPTLGFYSSEFSTIDYRPELSITVSGIPEVSNASLLVAIAILLTVSAHRRLHRR